jgi:hypothetical protein
MTALDYFQGYVRCIHYEDHETARNYLAHIARIWEANNHPPIVTFPDPINKGSTIYLSIYFTSNFRVGVDMTSRPTPVSEFVVPPE